MSEAYCANCETRVKVVLGRCHLCGSELRRLSQGFSLDRFSLTVGQCLALLGCMSAMCAFVFSGYALLEGKGSWWWLPASAIGFFHSLAMWFVFSHVKNS